MIQGYYKSTLNVEKMLSDYNVHTVQSKNAG